MPIATARHDGLQIAYESFGSPRGDPLLLEHRDRDAPAVLAEAFWTTLVDRRLVVARFDNREAGLSTHLSQVGVPNLLRMLLRRGAGAPPAGGHGR